MSKQASLRSKPNVNVATMGQAGHGKTTLTDAIRHRQAHRTGVAPGEPLDVYPGNVRWRLPYWEYETAARHYAHANCITHGDFVKHLIMGRLSLDGGLLVVSEEGPTAETGEQVRLAYRVGVPAMVVFLNRTEQGDEDWLDLIEVETRQLLNEAGYPGDEILVVRGNALAALESKGKDDVACACIDELLRALDGVPQPERAEDGSFLMAIEDVFHITHRGTVVTGRIERGKVRIGEEVEILGLGRPPKRTIVVGIEMFQKPLEYGMAGDSVGMLLRGVEPASVERGQVMATPGTISTHVHFAAEVYLMTEQEGGRITSIASGYRPRLFFRTTDLAGEVALAEGVECCPPGGNVSVTIRLPDESPVAMEEGLRFGIREGGRTVGSGVVTQILA